MDFPNKEDLERGIETTLAHEISHYMGFSEETIAEYSYD
jgi:predicted Zn-dependent protease with MMP-like domain